MEIFIPVLSLGLLGLFFGIGLAIASRRLEVKTDARLKILEALLPGADCGVCGQAGCFGFAQALLGGKADIRACRVTEDNVREQISRLLGKDPAKEVKRTALLSCSGGIKAKDKYSYQGLKDCVAANLLLAGQKSCVYACLGLGTCVKACPFRAIRISQEGLPVVDQDKCRACNKCVLACPKKLFRLAALKQRVFVACKSRDAGKIKQTYCPTGCIACKLCMAACKFEAIHVIDNLAVIDYNKCTSCAECLKVCPAHTIRIR